MGRHGKGKGLIALGLKRKERKHRRKSKHLSKRRKEKIEKRLKLGFGR